jgi:hypothetical protein
LTRSANVAACRPFQVASAAPAADARVPMALSMAAATMPTEQAWVARPVTL